MSNLQQQVFQLERELDEVKDRIVGVKVLIAEYESRERHALSKLQEFMEKRIEWEEEKHKLAAEKNKLRNEIVALYDKKREG